MWMFVSYDLPTGCFQERKSYRLFVKQLKHEGFIALHESFFYRYCLTPQIVERVRSQVLSACPESGKVAIVGVPQNCYQPPVAVEDQKLRDCFQEELPVSFF